MLKKLFFFLNKIFFYLFEWEFYMNSYIYFLHSQRKLKFNKHYETLILFF